MSPASTALGVTFAIQTALAAGVYAPPVLAALAEADIGVPASAVGVFTAIVYLAAACASLLSGLLIARLGPVRVSQLCLVVCALALAAVASARLELILVAAVFLGAAYGPATPASSLILVRLTPARLRATILSLKQTGVPAGGIAVGAILPVLSLAFGWRIGAVAIALLCLGLAALCEVVRAPLDRAASAESAARLDLVEPLRLAWRHRQLGQLAAVAFLYSGVQVCYASYLVLYLVAQAQLSVVAAGAGISAFMLGGLFGRVLWGAVADRTRRGQAVLSGLGLFTGAMSLVLTLLGPQWPTFTILALCLLAGLSAIAWNGVQLAEVATHAPQGRVAAATGTSMVFSYLGVVVAPLLFWSLLLVTGSYPAGFVLCAVLSVAGAALLLRR